MSVDLAGHISVRSAYGLRATRVLPQPLRMTSTCGTQDPFKGMARDGSASVAGIQTEHYISIGAGGVRERIWPAPSLGCQPLRYEETRPGRDGLDLIRESRTATAITYQHSGTGVYTAQTKASDH